MTIKCTWIYYIKTLSTSEDISVAVKNTVSDS